MSLIAYISITRADGDSVRFPPWTRVDTVSVPKLTEFRNISRNFQFALNVKKCCFGWCQIYQSPVALEGFNKYSRQGLTVFF